MSSEKVLVIVEMDGTFLEATAGDFVDVRVINWAAIREEGGLRCPECGSEEAAPDMTTASDVWICDRCGTSFDRGAPARLSATVSDLLAALEDVELSLTQARIASTIGKKSGQKQADFLRSQLERIGLEARAAINKAEGKNL